MVFNFDIVHSLRVKEIEKTTNHDVKAVEYFLKEHLSAHPDTVFLKEYVHFCCTSEDINNLSYARILQDSLSIVIVPKFENFLQSLSQLSLSTASVPLLALTHGQAATPTTFGREMAVYLHRLNRQLKKFNQITCCGKFNGATGSFNAHLVAYPEVDWETLAQDFVESSLSLEYQPVSTQIECHDYISELCDSLSRMSSILIGFSRDMWTYISRGVLKLRVLAGEVGSSTMPHKVNPIDFENAEGNFGLAISLMDHFSNKLIISRLQRDLSDSTVLRNLGSAFAHFIIGVDSLARGVDRVAINETQCHAELDANWSVLAEPVQTVLRKCNVENPYEKLKEFTRGHPEVNEKAMRQFIESLRGVIPLEDFKRLEKLTPFNYLGIAEKIANRR